MEYVDKTMTVESHEPVYAGDTVTCEAEMTTNTEQADRTLPTAEFVCSDQSGVRVMSGGVRADDPGQYIRKPTDTRR